MRRWLSTMRGLAALAGLPFTDEVMGLVDEAYVAGATMGSGFRALLKTLLAKLDLIYLDPLCCVYEIPSTFRKFKKKI